MKDFIGGGLAGVVFAYVLVYAACCSMNADECASMGKAYSYTTVGLVGVCEE